MLIGMSLLFLLLCKHFTISLISTPKPLKKTISFIFFFICVHHITKAQYADKQNGPLKNEIWWFDWAGMNLVTGDTRNVTLPDGLIVSYSITPGSGQFPNARVMNTWSGAILHLLYDFTNTNILPALYHTTPAAPLQCSFTVRVTATRNGSPVPFTVVAADAEASLPSEVTNLVTNGGPWQAIDFYRNSGQTTNPLSGCNTQNILISDTYGSGSQRGQNPVIASTSTTGSIAVNTVLNHQVNGGMAVAFGIMAPIDRGDLPASYGYVQHGLTYTYNNGCNFMPPLPAATHSQSLTLGAVAADADGLQTLNDNAAGADEDALSVIPVYTHNGTYSITVSLSNTTGSDAWLTGWFDYDRNSIFDPGESVTVLVPANSTSVTLTWAGLPTYLPTTAVTDYGLRLRLSSDRLAIMNPTGYAMDGEVEDHLIPAKTLCAITLQTRNDTAVCKTRPVQLTTTGTYVTDYSWDNSTFLSSTTIADPVSTPASTTRYIVTGNNPQGCEAKDTVWVTVNPDPVITMSNDTVICDGSSVQISASSPGAITYAWVPNSTLNNTTISTPVATPVTQTTYVVKVEDGNGCTNEDSVKLAIAPTPVVTMSNDTAICKGSSVQISASSPGGIQYTWLPNPTLNNNTISTPVVTPVGTTTYTVAVEGSNGCIKEDSVKLSIISDPVITLSNDTSICNGSSVQLSASSPGVLKYTWVPNPTLNNNTISTPVATPVAPTTYVVEVETTVGCISEDSVKVGIRPPAVFAATPASAVLCEKDSVLLNASGGDEYTWVAQDGSLLGKTASLFVRPGLTQTYEVLITENTCNTSDTRHIPVTVNARPVPAVTKSNDVDCSTGKAYLQARGGIIYTWDAIPGVNDINNPNQTVAPRQTTTYYVTIIDDKGCMAKDSVTVLADFTKAVSSYPIPSAFSPNNDGRNDCFGLIKWGQITELRFQVFNRWGERVFSTTDPTRCWDGRFKGILQPAGGFAYIIKAVTACGTVNKSGMVMLIK